MELITEAAPTEHEEVAVETATTRDLLADSETPVDEVLVEEICIDGMCGVY